jgi:G3E family GTPase
LTTRISIVGGFLGAGKTTLILAAAEKLVERGYRVGLVTNDQGEDLVDTALAEDATIPVTEVAGGCFCCRFPDLLAGLQRLQEVASPDIILAEPVGSCTDLIATVLRPLVQFYGEQYELAPLTVLLDSSRSMDDFPADIRYLHEQQVAEAEILLLSKSDLTGTQSIPEANGTSSVRSLPISAHTGNGVDEWLSMILGQTSRNPEALLIDYDRYAKAEAALGWLNAKGQVRADTPYSARQWMATLLATLERLSAEQQASVAHIKTLVITPQAKLKASLTQAGSISWDLDASSADTGSHKFILNVRVNATPGQLEQIAMQAIEAAKPDPSSRYYMEHFECFSPLPPRPTHRL